MPLSDRAIGTLLHIGSSSFLAYYLVWVFFTPFVDEDHPFQNFFPPKEYGVALPAVVLGCIFTFLTTIAFWGMYGVKPPKEDLKLYEKYSKLSSTSSANKKRKSSSSSDVNSNKKSSSNVVG